MAPNQPRTDNPAHPIRFGNLWEPIKAVAVKDGVTASVVVREAVRRYLKVRQG